MDQDYISDLSEEHKKFLNKFNEEYYGASLDFDDLNNNLHNTKALKKDCTDRNNARNRCLYGISKASGKLDDIESLIAEDEPIDVDIEDDKSSL